MNENLQEAVNQIILWAGGIGVLVVAASAWLSKIVSERIQHSWKKNADLELESVKGSIAKNNIIITSLLGQQGQAYQKVLEKNIEASQKAWDAVLKLKATIPSVVSLSFDIFLDKELENGILDQHGNSGPMSALIKQIDEIAFSQQYGKASDEIRQLRPFLTEKLALLLYVYGAFLGRLVMLLTTSYRKGKVNDWKKDNNTKGILKSVLTDKEADHIFNSDLPNYSLTVNLLETKIIAEIQSMLSNERITGSTIEQVEKLTNVMKNAEVK
jgi:hypothetical protein